MKPVIHAMEQEQNQEHLLQNAQYVVEQVKLDKFKTQYLDKCKRLEHVIIAMEQVKL